MHTYSHCKLLPCAISWFYWQPTKKTKTETVQQMFDHMHVCVCLY